MALRAREVLSDCEHALADFAASGNTVFQRPRWVAITTLLRTVGYVLKDVDRPVATPETQRRIDDAWERLKQDKPEPRIFHDFIDDERHKAVHLYEIRSAVNITIRFPGIRQVGRTRGSAHRWSAVSSMNFLMRDGPFEGRDALKLCREAIRFWRAYLDAIEGK